MEKLGNDDPRAPQGPAPKQKGPLHGGAAGQSNREVQGARRPAVRQVRSAEEPTRNQDEVVRDCALCASPVMDGTADLAPVSSLVAVSDEDYWTRSIC